MVSVYIEVLVYLNIVLVWNVYDFIAQQLNLVGTLNEVCQNLNEACLSYNNQFPRPVDDTNVITLKWSTNKSWWMFKYLFTIISVYNEVTQILPRVLLHRVYHECYFTNSFKLVLFHQHINMVLFYQQLNMGVISPIV